MIARAIALLELATRQVRALRGAPPVMTEAQAANTRCTPMAASLVTLHLEHGRFDSAIAAGQSTRCIGAKCQQWIRVDERGRGRCGLIRSW